MIYNCCNKDLTPLHKAHRHGFLLIHHLILLLQCHADQAIGLATFNFSGNAPLHGDKCALIIANTLHPRGDPGWHDPEHLSVYEISAKIAADEARDFARLPRSARKHPQSSLSREFASVTGKDNVIRAGLQDLAPDEAPV